MLATPPAPKLGPMAAAAWHRLLLGVAVVNEFDALVEAVDADPFAVANALAAAAASVPESATADVVRMSVVSMTESTPPVDVATQYRGETGSPATNDLPITMRLAEPQEPFELVRSA